MKDEIKLTQLGRTPQNQTKAVNVSMHRASTVLLDSLAELRDVQRRFDATLVAMIDHYDDFAMGYSWGGFESLVVPAFLMRRLKLHNALKLGSWCGISGID